MRYQIPITFFVRTEKNCFTNATDGQEPLSTEKNCMKRFITLLGLCCTSFLYFSCSKDGTISGSPSGYTGGAMYSAGGGSGSGSGGAGGGSSNPGDTAKAGRMTAGEWNDLDNWNFWKGLMNKDTLRGYQSVWGFYPSNRISIVLRDASGQLVHDAKLTATQGSASATAITDNFGKADLFPGLFQSNYNASGNFSLKAEYRGQTFDLGVVGTSETPVSKTIPVAKLASATLDVMFVVDATGSMGDEISYLKTEIKDVINRAGGQLPGTNIRMGSVFYRDNGDEYVTRPFNFTSYVKHLTNFINNQQACGGGDTPEAVDQGLDVAVNQLQWSSSAVNRIMFLILDAPSHKSQDVLDKLRNAVVTAQKKGIRIIPVSASGIDHETEFLLRFLSISTSSTYVFITNHSGIGGPHLEPTVGNYEVEYLNNLMVRLISKYGKNMN